MRRYRILLFLIVLLVVPLLADATSHITYQPLVGIPGAEKTTSLAQFLQALFNLSLAVGAILAVLMLVIGGFQWMASEAAGQKEAGRERVKNAIIGLLILLAAILILRTINPNLVNLNIVANAPGVNAPVAKLSGTSSDNNKKLDCTSAFGEIPPGCALDPDSSPWSPRYIPKDEAEQKRNPDIQTVDKPYAFEQCTDKGNKGSVDCCQVLSRGGGFGCTADDVIRKPQFYRTEEQCKSAAQKADQSEKTRVVRECGFVGGR